ncbi:MAG: MoaD/ThiS family protein [Pseudomonadota bacterium]|nr:MoaD/ThiS family protein [Pseudomonadota bacterium]
MITVKYFASLRERMGREQDTLEPERIRTARDVWDSVSENGDPPGNLLVAVNHEYADLAVAVNDGDEVAFFPPVTGG